MADTILGDMLDELCSELTLAGSRAIARGPNGRGLVASLVRELKERGVAVTKSARQLMDLYAAHGFLNERGGLGVRPWGRKAAAEIDFTLSTPANKNERIEFIDWAERLRQQLVDRGYIADEAPRGEETNGT